MKYIIGSFNMCKFNFTSTDDVNKNFEKISQIIKDEQFDVVAMQEIFSIDALNKLLRYLGPNTWKGCWDTPNAKSSQAAEGYAFIWNTRRLDLVKNRYDKVFEPRILNQYKTDEQFNHRKLVRNPFYARFTPRDKPGGSAFEIRLINTHIMFNDKDTDFGDVKLRKAEYAILAKCIYPKTSDKEFDLINGERDAYYMPSYTILLGDYNLNIKNGFNESPHLEEVIIINEANSYKKIITVQDERTTLKAKPKDGSSSRGYASNYDHFTYDAIRFDSLYVTPKRVDAVRKYYGDDFDLYRTEVSDHIPIRLEIDFKGR